MFPYIIVPGYKKSPLWEKYFLRQRSDRLPVQLLLRQTKCRKVDEINAFTPGFKSRIKYVSLARLDRFSTLEMINKYGPRLSAVETGVLEFSVSISNSACLLFSFIY